MSVIRFIFWRVEVVRNEERFVNYKTVVSHEIFMNVFYFLHLSFMAH